MSTLADATLRSVPVIDPQTSLDEAIALLEADPLQTVVLVGDEMYMGILNAAMLESSLIPAGADRATLQVGPYVRPTRPLSPETTTQEALAALERKGAPALPVVAGNVYKGVITRAELG
ncbi:CBS domain-containing protein [Armatimonas rosea]|uniref:CBS domain-containing protein n=1 Tax=Armatimonas rosea TaxID=685828 RepID=A0A7W9SS86_ARMRO|nr:CBS domain-containing protein [Armatimonas rosea]MBB6051756.1 CBS domain-containing protein [Armatimonas rosea]